MRAHRLAGFVLVLAAAPALRAGDGTAEDRHPAEAVVRELTRAIDFFDLEGFVACFHEDVTMFYPIDRIARRVDGLEALAATQERVFSGLRERFREAGRSEGPYFGLVPLDLEVQDLAGGRAAAVTWHVDRGTHLGRRTAVVEERGGAWKIASYHASNVATPEPEATAAAADAGCERQWTFPVPFYQSVAWAPDGSRIAYAAVTTSWDDGYRIFVAAADGSDPRRLDAAGAALFPAFSPDGSRIAFQSKRDGDAEVYVMGADGTQIRRLTDDPASDGHPTWSPDGSRIAFHSDRDGDYGIYVMRADGSDPVPITDHPADDYNPAWSPDGRRIAFDSDRDGVEGDEIYLVAPDGSGLERVVDAGVFPTWSPDGAGILFARDGLYAAAADGSALTRLLPAAVHGAWSPDGATIAAAAIEYDPDCRDHHSLVLLAADGTARRKLLP